MRLWNAHRRVLHKRVLPLKEILRLKKEPDGWRQLLTEDVVKFVDDLKENNLEGSEKTQKRRIRLLLQDPAKFFSRPIHVPLQLRKQVYLPDFVITLIRTPHLPPKYASFWVPLWFNKLDFKNYLKNVYNVDVLHVRSFVQQQKVQRERRQRSDGSDDGQGKLFREPARKKMTAELIEPFVYPEEEKDLSPWEAESFKRETKEQQEIAEQMSSRPQIKANIKGRNSIAQQAQEYLKGQQRWKPSWKSIPADARIMQNITQSPGARGAL